MGVVDEVVHTVSPYLSALGFGISLLVVSTTYGVSSVLLLFGTNEGERILGPPSMWSWRAWVGLPAIPIALLSTQTRWADSTLPFATVLFLRASTANATATNTSNASTGGALGTPFPQLQLSWPPSPLATLGLLPWVRLIYNNVYYATQAMMSRHLKLKLTPPPRRRRSGASILTNQPQQNARRLDNNQQDQPERNPEVDILLGRGRPPSFSAIFTGTLLWPMISNITGSWLSQFKWVREQFPEPFHSNILGGCLFVVVRDIGSLIYRYQKVCQYRSRRIRNYADFSSTSAKRSRRSNRSR
ncbi:hypothetical protein BC940DRAFT_58850 [Gongronella butleri]|nr:hypothetical protein BC940DRAFT_58850 [Gongronella butleri]